MTSTFFMPSVNIMGAGCLQEAMVALKGHGFGKALIVTDAVLSKLGRGSAHPGPVGRAADCIGGV